MTDRAMTRPRLRVPAVPAVLTLGVFGWLSFIALAIASYRQTPPSAAFDLELLLQGGRHVAAGTSPYSTALIQGKAVEITDLFYTYPPIVAQALSLVAAVPSAVIFAIWVDAATLALGAVAVRIARQFDPARPAGFVALAAVAVALVQRGVRRFVVAGGETSGAVVQALGVRMLRIGRQIDPGVPATATIGDDPLALALKSGNFGAVDFFAKALRHLEGGAQ